MYWLIAAMFFFFVLFCFVLFCFVLFFLFVCLFLFFFVVVVFVVFLHDWRLDHMIYRVPCGYIFTSAALDRKDLGITDTRILTARITVFRSSLHSLVVSVLDFFVTSMRFLKPTKRHFIRSTVPHPPTHTHPDTHTLYHSPVEQLN